MKKIFLIIGGSLVVVGIALFVMALFASGFDFSKFGTAKYETSTAYIDQIDQNFSTIEIDSKDTDVTLKPAEDDRICIVSDESDKIKHSFVSNSVTLKIVTDDMRKWYDHISFFSKRMKMTVYLPSEIYQSLIVDAGTGDVTIPGSFRFDSIDIQTSTGDVDCKASAENLIKIKTSTGDIRLKDLYADNIDLSVSTGDIVTESVTCVGLRSDGSTGDIRLADTVASQYFTIERSTGDVKFDSSDAEQISVKTSTGDVTGTLLTSKEYIANTSTGDINVPDTKTGGRCEVKTSTGDIIISLR